MKKLKVITVVGTRPEIIRLSRVIARLDEYCNHILVHTGQNYDYELNEIFFKDLHIRKPDYFLDSAGNSSSETIGNVIIKTNSILSDENPDAVLVLGDTNSCLSILPAKRQKIPTFHMEAGNRCFDMRVPEEINRKIVDHIADVNLTYSSIAREYLLKEGLPSDFIIKTGSPMNEVLNHYSLSINNSKIIDELDLEKEKYFLVSCHREENIDNIQNFKKFVAILKDIAKTFKIPIIVSTHPRTQKKLTENKIKFSKEVILSKPLGYYDYNYLQMNAKVVLSDSGTINEESSILNFPALNIRDSHERPEGMEEASVMMVGLNKERVIQGINILNDQPRGEDRLLNLVSDYSNNPVSHKVVRIIHSYVDYIRSNVWKQY